ncbi:MAG: UDP-N-acetylglucosamine 2-epimerase (non-hydrolyzing) [Oscillospiraceae bacterium]|nr:UDP-N-acetylglucosamine 2-epimerase (non-hydrolyzing) [Oscillospiraceae bacterium]
MKVLSVFGTRPEAIKMCPLVRTLKTCDGLESLVCTTGQHREMLSQVLSVFGVKPDYEIDLMTENQSLTAITTGVLNELQNVLEECRPDIVLVHGDTTTSFAAALAAFYRRIPVGHVEAGLRTWDRYAPYPEEMNRQLTGRIAQYHFAPTQRAAENLRKEGVVGDVFVTGNTVIDAFATTVRPDYVFREPALRRLDFSKKVILLTAHRRENLGAPLREICGAAKELCARGDVTVVYPVHLNPAVRETVFDVLRGTENCVLTDPVDVMDMHNLLSRCYMVLTDSGGLQEEAPHFGKPVLVLREQTERPEAVEAGTVRVVGTRREAILAAATELLTDAQAYRKMSRAVNPYGDGKASGRIAKILCAIASPKEDL